MLDFKITDQLEDEKGILLVKLRDLEVEISKLTINSSDPVSFSKRKESLLKKKRIIKLIESLECVLEGYRNPIKI